MSKDIYILNGPNLNLLGQREPDVYGNSTLKDIEALCDAQASQGGQKIVFRQTNSEGELVDWTQEAATHASALIINAGAYTHTSIALRDALASVKVPIIEVHLSNIFAREDFRHQSHVSPFATGIICGLGAQGYARAIDALFELMGVLPDANKQTK